MKYFAYGSNMLAARLQARTPSAVPLGVGILRGHVLRFDKHGSDGSGKCNLARGASGHDLVYGILFAVDDAELDHLDTIEGGYTRTTVEVETAGGGAAVETYFGDARFIDRQLLPFDWYQALVVAGALEHGLPTSYCDAIASLPAIRDPDTRRRGRAITALGRFRPDFEAGCLITSCRRSEVGSGGTS